MTYVLRFANDADGRDTVAQFTGAGSWPPPETLALISHESEPEEFTLVGAEGPREAHILPGGWGQTYWTRHHFSALNEDDHPLGVPTIRGALYVPEGYVDD